MTACLPDSAAAAAFVRRLHGDGLVQVVAIPPDRKGIDARTFATADDAGMRAFVEEHEGRRNLYVGVNPVRTRLSKKADKADVAEVRHLHCDIDYRAGEPLDDERARILHLLTDGLPAGVPPPSAIWFSGGGYWATWRLSEPLPAEDGGEAERRNRALAHLLGGDHATDFSRIARLPYTTNIPDEKKQKKGRVKAVAEVIRCDDTAYDASALPDPVAAAGLVEPRGGTGGAALARAMPAARRVADLPKDVQALIADGQGDHPSRSEAVWEVCLALARKDADDDSFLGILLNPELPISASVREHGAAAEKYARRQMQRAREAVAAEPPILHREEPLRSAREFRRRCRPTLLHYNGDWLAYERAAYADLEAATVRSELYDFLDGARTRVKDELLPFNPNRAKVANVLDALEGVAHRPRDIYAPPCWLEGDGPSPAELLACRNGLLHLPTGELHPPTPRFFTRNALAFDYDPAASAPERWLAFLGELWGGDGAEIALLQEIVGYLLVPDTSQQKVFLLVGPPRSGKGTIARVLSGLVGENNICAPSLNSLGDDFGLQPLLGKQLALISDMRLDHKTSQAAIAENLLRISGEDTVTANRKYKEAWTGRLAVRFMIITNELPKLKDASGAVANRFVPLTLRNSFLGRENPGLTGALLPELPGILCWAIAGWRRLKERGHFVLPEASAEAIADMHDLGSPVAAFLRERCEVVADAETAKADVWQAWKAWCEEHEQRVGDPRQFGVQLLAAANGRVAATKPRVNGERCPSYAGLRLRPPPRDNIPF